MMFAAPPEQSLEWSDNAVEGAHRFLRRVWKSVQSHVIKGETAAIETSALTDEQKALRRKTHETIKNIHDSMPWLVNAKAHFDSIGWNLIILIILIMHSVTDLNGK